MLRADTARNKSIARHRHRRKPGHVDALVHTPECLNQRRDVVARIPAGGASRNCGKLRNPALALACEVTLRKRSSSDAK
jgi:hypothetical protein